MSTDIQSCTTIFTLMAVLHIWVEPGPMKSWKVTIDVSIFGLFWYRIRWRHKIFILSSAFIRTEHSVPFKDKWITNLNNIFWYAFYPCCRCWLVFWWEVSLDNYHDGTTALCTLLHNTMALYIKRTWISGCSVPILTSQIEVFWWFCDSYLKKVFKMFKVRHYCGCKHVVIYKLLILIITAKHHFWQILLL